MVEEQSGGQVSWNSAQFLIMEISTLRANANQYCLKGDYIKAFECLRAVKRSTIQSFKSNDRLLLKAKEKEFEECLRFQKLVKPQGFSRELNFPKGINEEETRKLKRELLKKINNIVPLYEDYSELLSDLLEKCGYLIPAKQDASKMSFGKESENEN